MNAKPFLTGPFPMSLDGEEGPSSIGVAEALKSQRRQPGVQTASRPLPPIEAPPLDLGRDDFGADQPFGAPIPRALNPAKSTSGRVKLGKSKQTDPRDGVIQARRDSASQTSGLSRRPQPEVWHDGPLSPFESSPMRPRNSADHAPAEPPLDLSISPIEVKSRAPAPIFLAAIASTVFVSVGALTYFALPIAMRQLHISFPALSHGRSAARPTPVAAITPQGTTLGAASAPQAATAISQPTPAPSTFAAAPLRTKLPAEGAPVAQTTLANGLAASAAATPASTPALAEKVGLRGAGALGGHSQAAPETANLLRAKTETGKATEGPVASKPSAPLAAKAKARSVQSPRPVAVKTPGQSLGLGHPATAGVEEMDFAVQVGAFPSTTLADEGLRATEQALPGDMRGKLTVVQPVTTSGTMLYRSIVGGFKTRRQAVNFCMQLRTKNRDCFVR